MRLYPTFLALALAFAAPFAAAAPEGAVLDYRLRVRTGDAAAPVDLAFRLETLPALVTRNRLQQPRMGGWRIGPAPSGAAPSPAMLVRILGLCYFSGPGEQAVPLAQSLTLGGRRCRLWQVPPPPGVAAYIYLAEVAPHLLALAYLSAVPPGGDPRSVEVHLTGLSLGPRTAPAEEGTALLKTLRHWAAPGPRPVPAVADDPAAMATEEVP
jgi:hypothetical protein